MMTAMLMPSPSLCHDDLEPWILTPLQNDGDDQGTQDYVNQLP